MNVSARAQEAASRLRKSVEEHAAEPDCGEDDCLLHSVRRVTESPELADERADVLNRFAAELAKATGDGSKKRQAGTKPPWYEDDSHAAAMYRHLERWEAGERHDPDHEAHPLVAAAWRCLAIACKESGNVPNG